MSENAIEKVVIIGSGPAGWCAATYAARAQLQPLVYEPIRYGLSLLQAGTGSVLSMP